MKQISNWFLSKVILAILSLVLATIIVLAIGLMANGFIYGIEHNPIITVIVVIAVLIFAGLQV